MTYCELSLIMYTEIVKKKVKNSFLVVQQMALNL